MANSRTVGAADTVVARLERTVAEALRREVGGPTRVTVALSGGVDSIVLLDLLRRICRARAIDLDALHIHHGLSRNADAWERFCREHCRRRGVAFESVRVVVGGDGANVEAQARKARYAAFVESGAAILALAHHRDDQAETVLLRLLRGAGVHGLGAMAPARRLGPGHERGAPPMLIRPLLAVARAEILAYANARRLRWVEDDSNADDRYTRNFLRKRVFPLLETRFPGAQTVLARNSALLAEAAELLDELAGLDSANVVEGGRINAGRLHKLGPARAANVMRVYLSAIGEPMPSAARTREILRQLCDGRGDTQPEIRLSGGSLRRFRGWIELVQVPRVDAFEAPVVWRGEARLRLPAGGELRASHGRGSGISVARLANKAITVRQRRGGERMQPDASRPTRTLKNLLQEAGVAPWVRQCMPLVYCAERLIWAPRIGPASAYRARADERAVRFTWIEPGPDTD